MSPTKPADALAKLREPFAPEHVGKLPRVTCKECSNPKARCPKEDGEHRRRKCDGCKAFVSPAHIHIDFVGHALVTDRLLSVDPEWAWEPMALAADGSPAIGRSVNGRDAVMWVRLTVAGVTRPGVGSAPLDSHETEKQLIGDALRNAAMRFGVALDLWAKSELESAGAHDDPPEAPHGTARPAAGAAQGGSPLSPPGPPPNRSANEQMCAGKPAPRAAKPKRVGSAWVREFLAEAEKHHIGAAVHREIAEGISEGRTQSLSGLLETEAAAAMRALETVIADTAEPAA